MNTIYDTNDRHNINFLKLLKAEIRHLLHNPTSCLTMVITVLSPAFGLNLYRPIASASPNSYSASLNSIYLGNPALTGTLIGAIGFALLTAVTLNRDNRSQMEPIIHALLPPYLSVFSKVISLISLALLTQGVTLLLWLPYTRIQIGSHFRLDWYLEFYLVLMLFAMLFAILFVAAVYQICCHFEFTLFIFAAVTLLSLTVCYSNWLLRWIWPPVYSLSDDFGNYRLFLTLCYNRLFLLLFTIGLFGFSFLWNRNYHKNWFRSIPYNLPKWQFPLIGILFLSVSFLCYIKQPFFDHSRNSNSVSEYLVFDSDYLINVFWNSISAEVTAQTSTGYVSGKVIYHIQNNNSTEQTIKLFSNPGYTVKTILWDEEEILFRDLQNDIRNIKTIEITIPALSTGDMTVIWGGFPKEWDILSAMPGNLEVSKDYLYLVNTNLFLWLANIKNHSYSPSAVELKLTLPSGIMPLFFSDTVSVEKLEERNDQTIWRATNHNYSFSLYAGNYTSKTVNIDGTPISFYYSSTQKDLMEEYHAEEVIAQVFTYCNSHYGSLQFEGDNGMRLIEVGAVGGGYAAFNTSVIGEDSFYRQDFEDTLKGNGGNEVFAHEIIHQWWGLGRMFSMENSIDPWSSEGLTVYTTYRLMKELYGIDYAIEHYVAAWEQQVADYYQNFYVRHPEYLDLLPKNYQDNLARNYSMVRQYCEMPLKILKAEKLVGGEEAMDTILSNLFMQEADPSDPYLTYDDFLDACNLTREDLNIEITNKFESGLY